MTSASPTAASAAAIAMEKIATITPVGGLRMRAEAPKRDEIQVRGGEHHFNSDQNENGVTPAQHGEQTDGEQCRGDDQKKLESWSH